MHDLNEKKVLILVILFLVFALLFPIGLFKIGQPTWLLSLLFPVASGTTSRRVPSEPINAPKEVCKAQPWRCPKKVYATPEEAIKEGLEKLCNEVGASWDDKKLQCVYFGRQ